MGKVFHVCFICKNRWGPPMEWDGWPDGTETHGVCQQCEPKYLADVKKQIEDYIKRKEENHEGVS